MRTVEIPYSGDLLLANLMAYGLLVSLDAAGHQAFMSHSPDSLSFEPRVHLPDSVLDEDVEAAVRSVADAAEPYVEADMEPGATGNDRRSVIWARGSYANDTSRAREVVRRRAALVERAANLGVVGGLLAGLGAPATWGSDAIKPAHGATALDGVLGNHTSDLVRGVLRPARAAAGAIDGQMWEVGRQPDKTGWAPAGTSASLVHQWLAALGLGVLPVAHRSQRRSATPAVWERRRPRASGLVLPLFARPTSLPRARAIVGLKALPTAALSAGTPAGLAAGAELKALGASELVTFTRLDSPGAGSSVAFRFRRGVRVAL